MVALRTPNMPETGSLIAAIGAYLAAHPTAADSAAGVARWWLGESGASVQAQQVEQALDLLVRQGRLRRVQLADGNTLYCGAAPADEPPAWPM